VLRLRRSRFDLAILAAAPWRTAAATAATGAARRIGLARRKNARFLTDVLPAEDIRQPVLAELARLLEPIGIVPADPLRYELDPAPLEARREPFRRLLGDRPAALHPFASKRNRCVPLGQWIRVARELDRRGYDPLWIGSADELNEVRRAAGAAPWRYVDKLGDGTLADTAAALSLAHLFVGHDSGPLHVAGAFGVPVVGVFTPGEPLRTFPQGVGPSEMLSRESPDGVTAEELIEVVGQLPTAPPLRLMR
jgi:ADP-heptose:LPS heptosyltransferase